LSTRIYYRVKHNGKSFVLMDSTREPSQFCKFILTTYFFEKEGFSVPYIFQIDFEHSIALIEDLGNNKVNKYLMGVDLADEKEVYKKSLYLLSELQSIPIKGKDNEVHSKSILVEGIEEFVNHCVLDLYKPQIESELSRIVSKLPEPSIWSLRDFHVDNIMWLNDRDGIRKVGLLDYQDLSIGYQAYDVVSLLQDARRFIPPIFEKQMLEFFFDLNSKIDKESFMQEYRILSLQRNLRIYGLFTKSVVNRGLVEYQKYLPNVRNYIEREINNGILSDKVKKIILHSL